MNVLIIAQYYPPETGALASRWGDFSKILANQNHDVTVLCESPHYPNQSYFAGYKNSFYSIDQKKSNLKIIRTKAYASNRKTTIKKLTHYLVFMFSAILNIGKVKNYDLLIISSPPLFTGLIGLFIKKKYKKNFWLDLRDLWPDSALELNQLKNGKLFNFGKLLEKKIYQNAEGFIFPVPSFRGYLSNFSTKISNKPMIHLMNGVSKDFIQDAMNLEVNNNNKFTVLYSGNMGLAQDLKTIIYCAKILENYEIYFQFIGDGVSKSEIIELARPYKKKIDFIESMPRKKLITWIKNSSVCLVPLKKKKLFYNALPSKMFEYMACQKPVIVGVKGDAAKLVQSSKCGIEVEPENPKELSEAILKYFHNYEKINQHGKNGLSYITKNLTKEVLISNLMKKIEGSFENNHL